MKLGLVLGLQCRRLPCLGLSLVFVLLSAVSASSSKYDRENWVNPDDMINYDRASKTMIKTNENHRESQENEKTTDPPGSKEDCVKDDNTERENALREKLASCEKALSNMPSVGEGGERKEETKTTERQYMRRFVNVLVRALGLADGGTTTVRFHVSEEQLETLRRFGGRGRPMVALAELDEVLTQVLRPTDDEGGGLLDLPVVGWLGGMLTSGDALYKLLPFAITLVTLSMLVMRRQVYEIVATFLVLVFALSYKWTYDYMVKMAEIRQYVTLKQHEHLPAMCRARTDWSLFEYLVHRLTHDADECGRYHAAHMMDPALGVTPTIVLSEMLSAMLVHPAAGLGEGVARFSAGVLGGLSTFSGWIVLLISFVTFAFLTVLVIVVVCGGRVRLPFWFSGLEVTGGRSGHQPPVEGAPRAPVQEIRSSDPLVAAMSSSASEGLVLMNMPILERLMSARDDRAATAQNRDYVQRLAPVGDAGGSCCPQCGGGDTDTRGYTLAGRGDSDRRVATLGGKGDSDRRVATVDTLRDVTEGRGESDTKVTTLHNVMGGRGDSDRRVATVDTLCDVTEGRGDSNRGVKVEQASKMDSRLGGGDFAKGSTSRLSRSEEGPPPLRLQEAPPLLRSQEAPPPLGAPEPTITPDSDQLESSAFIDELRKILDESDTDQMNVETREDIGLTQEGRTDYVDTLANLLEECEGPRNPLEECEGPQKLLVKRSISVNTSGSANEVTDAELIRKVSSDSSDASGDFVKL